MANSISRSKRRRLNDPEINSLKLVLDTLTNADFPLKSRFEDVEKILTKSEQKTLTLVKLLYCLGYIQEAFLHLGVLVECKLNAIVELYIAKRWRTTLMFVDEVDQSEYFKKFKEGNLGYKVGIIRRFNLFNDPRVERYLLGLVESSTVLRNYGGHADALPFFFDTLINVDSDKEILNIILIIERINLVHTALQNNPPTQLP